METPIRRELITPTQAACMLGIPYTTVTKLCRDGVFPAVKVGRHWRINRDKLCRMYGIA